MAPRSPEARAQLRAQIREHRLSGIEWQKSCATLGISRSTYFRYLDTLSQDDLKEELLKDHRRFLHQFYLSKKRLIRVAWEKAQETSDPRFFALANNAENDLFDRLQEVGLLPMHNSTAPFGATASNYGPAQVMQEIWRDLAREKAAKSRQLNVRMNDNCAPDSRSVS